MNSVTFITWSYDPEYDNFPMVRNVSELDNYEVSSSLIPPIYHQDGCLLFFILF